MTYSDFYKIVCYVNENNRGKFTQRELEAFANNYLIEFEESKKTNIFTPALLSLYETLNEYNDLQTRYWMSVILYEVCKA